MSLNRISHFLIAGGTHGNEWIGVHLVEWLSKHPEVLFRSSFKSSLLISNPEAVRLKKRYVDTDLNRVFNHKTLSNLNDSTSEVLRGRAILSQFGDGGVTPADLVLDLHTTTSSTGPCLILSHDSPINLHLSRFLMNLIPNLKVALWGNHRDTGFLKDILRNGVTFEIGPVAPNTLRADHYFCTKLAVLGTLDFIEAWNSSPHLFDNLSLDLYEPYQSYDYPRDSSGQVSAMIHPELEGQDFHYFDKDIKCFITPTGEEITITLNQPSFPMFIGEASYYEKNIAFFLTSKKSILLPKHPNT